MRSHDGFTLVEVLVAWAVLTGAIVSTLSVFANSQRETTNAQRRSAMASVSQRELEHARALPPQNVALSAVPASAPEGALTGPTATEATVVDPANGRVDPGPTPFAIRGVTGRIYRYVTWRSATCSAANAKIGGQIDMQAGTTGTAANMQDLCPAANATRRVTLVVVTDHPGDARTFASLQTATLIADPAAVVQAAAGNVGLRVDSSRLPSRTAAQPQTAAEQAYGPSSTLNQTVFLYDTPCTAAARQPLGSDHDSHDTARAATQCSGTAVADLMGLDAPPRGSVVDYSRDLVRSPVDGVALKRDTVADPCPTAAAQAYSVSESPTRRWSLHRWVTKPLAVAAQTLSANGRATLTLFTHAVGGVSGAGRVCVTLRRASDGLVIGSSDYSLADWPSTTTQLSITFDIASAALAAGDRLELLVRAHPTADNDLELLYDRADVPSSLSLTMAANQGIS